jgi:hypothetical protein
MPPLPPPSSSFRSDHALRGARTRARELGILGEFWGLVSAGDLNHAMGRLALEETREERRQARRTSAWLACGVVSAVLGLTVRIWNA